MAKLTKRKEDIKFIDPVTMEVKCTFNQCIDKFTIKEYEDIILENGNEYTAFYHKCRECNRRVKGRGDSTKGWVRHIDRVISGENKFYSSDTPK